ncbi:DUF948 domain-containing protein [Oenococcus sicerae]|uniref:DUF948 domain-containing protein n=1 Tax=Oenococcus sicerae TaxID=2203724 RepID=A0AAJ1VM97_9LACO|nr:DUF948 domain-containing protein [Oenococcus sicerae]MDN6899421.1 DUF948 domain-containing protein [Oenococcus sicerae]QAS70120.1 DUF948 domain-containing protein [Oenococcus sicerae]VDK13691.1 hypothetical protein OAL24_00486 [Oenococcus sicerae]
MGLGQIAGLIAAIAFAILVIAIVAVLISINQTVRIFKKHIEPIASDADQITATTKSLLSDLTSKVERLDPVIQATADLGSTISHFTDKINKKETEVVDKRTKVKRAVKNFASSAIKSGVALSAGQAVFDRFKKSRSKKG